MALLTVLDDGDDTGEVVRIRGNSFVIGRVDGNVVIVHDNGMSGKHAEISRRLENGEYAWYLKDLQSTNGTFVRTATVLLSHGQELLIGSHRYSYEVPVQSAGQVAPTAESNATRKWEAISPSSGRNGGPARDRRHLTRKIFSALSACRARAMAGPRRTILFDRRRRPPCGSATCKAVSRRQEALGNR